LGERVSRFSPGGGFNTLHVSQPIITSAKEGYVFVVVCLFVCLLATLRENFQTDLHEIFREGWQWAKAKFWWRSD